MHVEVAGALAAAERRKRGACGQRARRGCRYTVTAPFPAAEKRRAAALPACTLNIRGADPPRKRVYYRLVVTGVCLRLLFDRLARDFGSP